MFSLKGKSLIREEKQATWTNRARRMWAMRRCSESDAIPVKRSLTTLRYYKRHKEYAGFSADWASRCSSKISCCIVPETTGRGRRWGNCNPEQELRYRSGVTGCTQAISAERGQGWKYKKVDGLFYDTSDVAKWAYQCSASTTINTINICCIYLPPAPMPASPTQKYGQSIGTTGALPTGWTNFFFRRGPRPCNMSTKLLIFFCRYWPARHYIAT